MKQTNQFFIIGTLITTFVILGLSLIIRIQFILSHAVFIDEFPNVTEAMMFVRDLGRFPPNYSGLLYDPLKPPFYRIYFGAGILLSQRIINATSSISISVMTQYARFSVLSLNFLGYLILLRKNWKRTPLFSFFLIAFLTLNPLLIFNTSIAETGAFIIPLMVLLIYYLSKANILNINTLIPVSIILALLESVQYYSVIFIIYSLIFILFNSRPLTKTSSSFIWLKNSGKLVLFLVVIPLVIFIMLNPSYWVNPLYAINTTLRSVAFPLTAGSGVYQLNVFFLGHSVSNSPPYAMIYYLILETPLLVLLMFLVGLFFVIRSFYERKKADYIILIGRISFLFFIGNFVLASIFPHFRGVSSLSILIMPPISILAAIGAEKLTLYIYYRFSAREIFQSNYKQKSEPRISDFKNIILKMRKTFSHRYNLFLALFVVVLLTAPIIYTSSPSFAYANALGKVTFGTGANISGSLDSGETDMMVADYMNSHNITNSTVVSLALTTDLSLYSPGNLYLQFWPTTHPVNSTYLLSNFFSDYLVVDEYYAQLYGNPVKNNNTLFPVITEFHTGGGYSILYHIGPLPFVNKSAVVHSVLIQ